MSDARTDSDRGKRAVLRRAGAAVRFTGRTATGARFRDGRGVPVA